MQCLKRILNVKQISKMRSVGVSYSVNENSNAYYYSTAPGKSCPILQVPIATKLYNQCANPNRIQCRTLLPNIPDENEPIDSITFEKVCEETLESLSEYFEELVEQEQHLKSADIAYSSGVLTVSLGPPHGTYVINRQSPNRQIWLSSPVSGPKRYDYCPNGKCWIYKHDGKSLHQLLQEEIPKVVNNKVDFSKCSYSSIL